ncbi:MAG: phosphoribosylformylglycinamidine synthase subunit PurQ [Planctomycetes bacterium]|nr:phosphoribosylformylglycinamidine synthase subunit PurQ [Planctomycetota bacterium]
MPAPRVCVLRAPGTNCDVETAFAFDSAGGKSDRLHLYRLLEQPRRLDDYQILCLPGGFSYGDDVGAGVIFSRQLSGRLGEALAKFIARDTLVLGICNGFQVLLKAGLLPDGAEGFARNGRPPEATLTWNDNGRYTALWVRLKNDCAGSVFLRGIEEIELPVAHGEGRLVVRDEAVLPRWREENKVALRYVPPPGIEGGAPPIPPLTKGGPRLTPPLTKGGRGGVGENVLPFPYNPNGSVDNIAGLADPSGRVLGLMPHPERFLHATQHPQWTRLGLCGEGEGMKIFRNAVAYFG